MRFKKPFIRSIHAFVEASKSLIDYRHLTLELAKREISERYSGQAFGLIWAILHPAILIVIYVFVFAVVFKQKIGGTSDLPLDYTTYLLSGLVSWLCFQESMAKSCTAITSNSNLVKDTIFPLHVLPVKGVASSAFTQLISLSITVAYVLLTYKSLMATYLLLPFLLIIQYTAMCGVAFAFSSISVFFRDLKDFVQVFCISGIYLMPIFYLPSMIPAIFKPLLFLNPFSYLIWCYQDILYFGRFEHWWAWPISIVLSLFSYIYGYRTFRKLCPHFGAAV